MNPSDEQKPKGTYSYPPPTQSGKIPFTPPGTDRQCETAWWLWGNLESKVPPLIVLHGGPGAPGRDLQCLGPLYERHGIPVLLYDQIGCGESTHLRDTKGDTSFWTDDLFLDELDNLKRHFGIETFDLLGHSCGGMLATLYALKQPRGLRKLVIASATSADELRLQAFHRSRAELPPDVLDTILTCEREGRTDSPEYNSAGMMLMHRTLCRIDPWPPEIEEVFAYLTDDDTVQQTLYGGSPLVPTGPRKDYDVRGRLKEITETTAPGGVLLTNGKYDMSPDPVMAPFFSEIRARLKWVRFGESSHMPHIEEQEAYLVALGDFLTMA